ncbi:MAG: GNAT family N-acetyltransferase [Planctomycetota bacterium]|nr:GNAT family N-acetyltransferase [Planctomycetota bacterium]MDA1215219.1 GNAT family N-acetyltransferase [Planctomycetota bacterium]
MLTVWYLQMFEHNGRTVPPPRQGLAVTHARHPTVAYYRFIYDLVGADYDWTTRKKMSDEQLAVHLSNPLMETHVFSVDGVPAGFADFDRRVPDEIEMVQFGLARDFIGQGLGKYFLQQMIDLAWSYQPKRFWLHTCSKDHAAALPNYQKARFVLYHEEVKE